MSYPHIQQSQRGSSYGGDGDATGLYSTGPEPNYGSNTYNDAETAAGSDGSYQMIGIYGSNGKDQDLVLTEVRDVDREIDEINLEIEQLCKLQSQYLNATDTSSSSAIRQDVDRDSGNIMAKFKGLVTHVKTIKLKPESGNARNSAQVGRVDQRLKTTLEQYQQVNRDYRKSMQDQIARQYRIVRPDATETDVREATENTGNQQIFSKALTQSNDAKTQNIHGRHQRIGKIEGDMMILAQLFQDLEALVVQQEAAVTNIEQKGEEVNDHVQGANTELDGAVKKARAARRKKWYCLGVGFLIFIITGVIVVVLVEVLKNHR